MEKQFIRRLKATVSLLLNMKSVSINEGIHRPFDYKESDFGDDPNYVKAYTLGASEVPLDSKVAYAKVSLTPNGTKIYAVKVGTDGLIFDPNGLYANGAEFRSSERRLGPSWRRVNEKCFNFYLKFLEKGNKANLSNATRELMAGVQATGPTSKAPAARDIKFVGGGRHNGG